MLSFKKDYSDLIVKIETKDIDNILNECKKRDLNKIYYKVDLVRVLFKPFKIITYIAQFILMFNHSNYPRTIISIAKSIIFDTFEQIRNQLWSSSITQKLCKFEEDIYFIFFTTIEKIPDRISELLQIMKFCELDKEMELVMNNLWKICLSYLSFIHPFFSRYSSEELQDWKKVMSEYDSSIYSKKLSHSLGYALNE
jgi:hypothetical protein